MLNLFEIKKQGTLEKAWKSLRLRTCYTSEVDHSLKLTSSCFMTHLKQQQAAAATWQWIMRILVYSKEILKENKMLMSHQTSVLHFFQPSWGARASSPLLLCTANDDPDYVYSSRGSYSSLNCLLLVRSHIFCKYSVRTTHGQNWLSGIITLGLQENLSQL